MAHYSKAEGTDKERLESSRTDRFMNLFIRKLYHEKSIEDIY